MYGRRKVGVEIDESWTGKMHRKKVRELMVMDGSEHQEVLERAQEKARAVFAQAFLHARASMLIEANDVECLADCPKEHREAFAEFAREALGGEPEKEGR